MWDRVEWINLQKKKNSRKKHLLKNHFSPNGVINCATEGKSESSRCVEQSWMSMHENKRDPMIICVFARLIVSWLYKKSLKVTSSVWKFTLSCPWTSKWSVSKSTKQIQSKAKWNCVNQKNNNRILKTDCWRLQSRSSALLCKSPKGNILSLWNNCDWNFFHQALWWMRHIEQSPAREDYRHFETSSKVRVGADFDWIYFLYFIYFGADKVSLLCVVVVAFAERHKIKQPTFDEWDPPRGVARD